MTASRFDAIARLFARRRQATPTAVPATWEKTSYLFVQSFQGGLLTPTGDPDRHTLTLEGGLGQTVYFSERPARDVGVTPTPKFLQTLGFSAENPPNAALLVDAGDGETDLAVVELFDPAYDEATHTATYQVRGLEAWEDNLAPGLDGAPSDLTGMPPEFGTAHLLIDECMASSVYCTAETKDFDWIDTPFCFANHRCMPCDPWLQDSRDPCPAVHYWRDICNETFPELCNGTCTAQLGFEVDLMGICTEPLP